MSYPWFDKLSKEVNDVQQGDLIVNCPIIKPPPIIDPEDTPEVEIQLINVIVLSQSCDLINGKLEIVLVSPVLLLEDFLDGLPPSLSGTSKARSKTVAKLRQGNIPGYHLLEKPSFEPFSDYLVIDFRNVYGIHFDALINIAEQSIDRIRLLPPYREHLSQAFARYFMRVGLPQDLKVDGY